MQININVQTWKYSLITPFQLNPWLQMVETEQPATSLSFLSKLQKRVDVFSQFD